MGPNKTQGKCSGMVYQPPARKQKGIPEESTGKVHSRKGAANPKYSTYADTPFSKKV